MGDLSHLVDQSRYQSIIVGSHSPPRLSCFSRISRSNLSHAQWDSAQLNCREFPRSAESPTQPPGRLEIGLPLATTGAERPFGKAPAARNRAPDRTSGPVVSFRRNFLSIPRGGENIYRGRLPHLREGRSHAKSSTGHDLRSSCMGRRSFLPIRVGCVISIAEGYHTVPVVGRIEVTVTPSRNLSACRQHPSCGRCRSVLGAMSRCWLHSSAQLS